MTTFSTRRHPLKFYTVLIFSFLFFISLGSVLLYSGIEALQKEQPKIKEYLMPVFGLGVIFLGFYSIYAYRRNSPRVTLDPYDLQIGDEVFSIADIKEVEFTGKMPFPYLLTYPMEGMAILFDDDTVKILFDDMYANSSALKLLLQQAISKKDEYEPLTTRPINREEINFENEEIFKGNQLTSFRGISLWGVVVFCAYVFFGKWEMPSIASVAFFSLFVVFWFCLHSWLMHYFGLANKYFIVRNHNFIWMKKIYPLSDIKEVVFETQSKQPNCLRVITNDFRSKLYPAGTLRDETWLDMKRQLESRGVSVRNESIDEE